MANDGSTKAKAIRKDDKLTTFTSKAVTGLKLTRNGGKFTAEWSKGNTHDGKNYSEIYIYYILAVSGKYIGSDETVLSGSSTSWTFNINLSDYFPTTSTGLFSVSVEVSAVEQDYETESVWKSTTNKKWYKQKTIHAADSSPFVRKTMTFTTQDAPTTSITPGDSVTTFHYDSKNADATNSKAIFRRVRYWTAYVKDWGKAGAPSGSWNGPYYLSGASGDIETTAANGGVHGAGNVTRGESYTQEFYIDAQYTTGTSVASNPYYVYAWPYKATGLTATTPNALGGGLTFNVKWKKVSDNVHPSETHCLQYCIGTPTANMGLPSSPSWTGSEFVTDKSSVDQTGTINTSGTVGEEEALWARVVQRHGEFSGDTFQTPSDPILVRFGGVKAPSASDITVDSYNSRTGAWTVSVDNPSSLSGSYMRLQIAVQNGNRYVVKNTYSVPSSGTLTFFMPVGTSRVRLTAWTEYGNYGSYSSAKATKDYTPTSEATDISAYAPYDLRVTPDALNCEIDLSWTKVLTGANSVTRITVATSADEWSQASPSFVVDTTVTGTSTSIRSNISYDTQYFVRLQGADGQKSTNWTDIKSCTIKASDAPIPSTLALSETDDHKIKVGWTWTWANANSIELSWSDTGIDEGNKSNTMNVVKKAGATNEAVYLTLERGKKWYVGARYIAQNGAYSNYVIKQLTLAVTPDTPTSVTLRREAQVTDEEGQTTVRLSWTNSWVDADAYEISYSKNPNAWDTADGPTLKEISGRGTSMLIGGLDLGATWYARVRLSFMGKFYSDYSAVASLDLRTIPQVTNVALSKESISQYGNLDISWAYSNEDLSEQESANIIIRKSVNNVPVASITVTTGTSAILYAEQYGLNGGSAGIQTYYAFVRTRSKNGMVSSASERVYFSVFNRPVAEITSTSLEDVIIDDGEPDEYTIKALTEMPLDVTVSGAEHGGTVTLMIERAEDVLLERPDGSTQHGYAGELIAMYEGDGTIELTQELLRMPFENNSKYTMSVFVTDRNGTSDTVTLDFTVLWDERAVVPEGSILVDEDLMIVKITPVLPQDAPQGCTCDIYRLSIDRPELIVSDAEWGTTYVDPYPAFGDTGGHRIVLMTSTGDYVTENGDLAWLDLDGTVDPESGDEPEAILMPVGSVIDFDGEQVVLKYNLDVSHSWTKDFMETKYLGGSVQGDWNPAVTRKVTMSTVMVTLEDEDEIEKIRRLATYPGICHVRTPDGSSFAADIQISEKRGQSSAHKVAEFSLNITRVDSEAFDGMKLSEWEA